MPLLFVLLQQKDGDTQMSRLTTMIISLNLAT